MQQLTSSCELLTDDGCVIGRQNVQSTRHLELGVELGPRADCDTHMIQVAPPGAARVPLRDVGRDRQGGPTKLRPEHETFRGCPENFESVP